MISFLSNPYLANFDLSFQNFIILKFLSFFKRWHPPGTLCQPSPKNWRRCWYVCLWGFYRRQDEWKNGKITWCVFFLINKLFVSNFIGLYTLLVHVLVNLSTKYLLSYLVLYSEYIDLYAAKWHVTMHVSIRSGKYVMQWTLT